MVIRTTLCAGVFVLLQAAGAPAQVAAAPQAFEVATVKAVDAGPRDGHFVKMEGTNRFVAKNFTLQLMIAAAYNVNPKVISGGPAWIDSTKFEIAAVTPGDVRPTREQQMSMLAGLLADRFQLSFHREQRRFALYSLSVGKGGAKLKSSEKGATDPSSVVSTVYPDHILMPARNASMQDFVAVLQRAVLDRPVVDKTGLDGRFDFDLEWAPSEREFGGEIEVPTASSSPPLVMALQQQLGLKLEATQGLAEALVIDRATPPSAN